MAQQCEICGRGSRVANSRSKSNIATKRLQKLNMQSVRIGTIKRLACTRCIRTLNKQRA